MREFDFDAFISYSHKDMQWAVWLQKKLETFHIPKEANAESKNRTLRVFRDQTDLAGAELQEALRKELDTSEYLIVICSPNSAESEWVNAEVRAFRDKGRLKYILPFIVAGEPESDHPELECYPEALRSIEGGRHMLGANVQEIGRQKAFLKLVSIILGIRFNRLVDREKQRKRRTGLLFGSISAGIAAVVIGLLVHNAQVINRNHELSYNSYMSAMLDSFENGEFNGNVDVPTIEASAKEGNVTAMALLASCYNQGYGTDVDQDAAFYWYQQAAQKGDSSCMASLGVFYTMGYGTPADPEEAFSWYLKSAEAGDPFGMFEVALAYSEGLGTEKDEEKAFAWMKKSADQDYESALMQLAIYYRDGIGCEQNPEKAFEIILKLAEMGNTTAMYNAALMYQYAYGTEENPEQAYYWYRRGANAGDADCAYQVGVCTRNNYGTSDAAVEWFKEARELAEEAGDSRMMRIAEEAIANKSNN